MGPIVPMPPWYLPDFRETSATERSQSRRVDWNMRSDSRGGVGRAQLFVAKSGAWCVSCKGDVTLLQAGNNSAVGCNTSAVGSELEPSSRNMDLKVTA